VLIDIYGGKSHADVKLPTETVTGTSSARESLIRKIREELFGPQSAEEIIEDFPVNNYLTGVLFPSDLEFDAAEDDSHNDYSPEEDSDEIDTVPSPSQSLRPSSMGLSCDIDEKCANVTIQVEFGTYTFIEFKDGRSRWQRKAHHHELQVQLLGPQADEKRSGRTPIGKGALIRWTARPRKNRKSVMLTVFLVNSNKQADDFNGNSLFQPKISLRASDNSSVIVQRSFEKFPGTIESEAETYELLFRDKREFAIGHGCSVSWGPSTTERTTEVWTTFIPEVEAVRLDPYDFSFDGNSMSRLADESRPAGVRALLRPLPDNYEKWINGLESRIKDLPSSLQAVAKSHLVRCKESLSRIREGIEIVCSDREALQAFRFANQAMSLQLAQVPVINTFLATKKRPLASPRTQVWHPFQLAFVLLNLKGIVDPASSDRLIVDLLWFPTGGGKTEAYMGLACFVMAYRRLRAKKAKRIGSGVAIIMRYTLRLLTTQQFQRAATLMCACELIRRHDPQTWGNEPFLVGLWVGLASTPNTFDQARDALDLLSKGAPSPHTPIQLHNCPWCGEPLRVRDYWIETQREWTLVSCPHIQCEFHGKKIAKSLPVLTVDQDIYRRCPALLIATVDKFARIAWKAEAASIFGNVNRRCPLHGYLTSSEAHGMHRDPSDSKSTPLRIPSGIPPPELIIQDELHLINGPLGTMVGLYETAIDFLCTVRDRSSVVPPKVIASTATIRRARDQIRKIFMRETSQFPPPGIDAGDSFFAREKKLGANLGRIYLGICAPGRSPKYALVWIYASLLQNAMNLASQGASIDPYWTLIGYFNSLRELGGALRLTEDDIPVRMGLIARRQNVRERDIRVNLELTSTVGSTAIPQVLSRLSLSVGDPSAIDILLATNMLSVGVDIQRLGLMVVNGQPKTTSEYLQATSRVGRSHPGLIVTLYNWYKARDVSHYERFESYHASLYRHVDAVTVTPFAPRARDRGLKAVIVGMSRMLDPALRENGGASKFSRTLPVIKQIEQVIDNRSKMLDPGEAAEVKRELDAALDLWEEMVQNHGAKLVYQLPPPPYSHVGNLHALLKHADDNSGGDSWKTPDSLRNVEPVANMYYFR
jgi:hypothetical protein